MTSLKSDHVEAFAVSHGKKSVFLARMMVLLIHIISSIIFLCAISAVVHAHSFYDATCCSDRDCHPYEGQVIPQKGGYYLPEFKKFIQYEHVKTAPLSAPEQYHICIVGNTVMCFYAREGGT